MDRRIRIAGGAGDDGAKDSTMKSGPSCGQPTIKGHSAFNTRSAVRSIIIISSKRPCSFFKSVVTVEKYGFYSWGPWCSDCSSFDAQGLYPF